jgi:hypothetical protein
LGWGSLSPPPIPQNAAFFTPKGAGAGRQISESPDLELLKKPDKLGKKCLARV